MKLTLRRPRQVEPPAVQEVALEPFPWGDPRTEVGRAYRSLAALLQVMAREAEEHPGQYRDAPDAKTLRQLSDVLIEVSATPSPIQYVRDAMRRWSETLG